MKHRSRLSLLVAAALLGACAVGPDYQRPAVQVPASYKESFAGWKTAEPRDHLPGEAWWKSYGDARLDELQAQAASANQNIQLAEAHYRQAQALSASARSALYPSLSADAAALRSKRSSNGNNSGLKNSQGVGNNYSALLTAGWEVDLWGRVKRSVEAGDAGMTASAADLAAARLSVQAILAEDYFQLRIFDTQQKLFNDTVATYERSLTLTKNRYAVGLATRSDVAQAEAQLRATRALAIDNSVQRTQLEHAIAVLLGKAPAEFELAVAPFEDIKRVALPDIPASLPSELLERRPDIAAAERRAAAANAEIGVAKAALFPTITLSATGGYQSTSLGDLVTVPSRIWSLGPLLAASLFDGGLRQAQTNAAIAVYDANVASYKQTVLNGFQEVEDNLAALRLLEQEGGELDSAVRFARESVQQTVNRYKAGTEDYLSVVTVQNTALLDERAAVGVLGRRLTASVGLFKALGGSAELAPEFRVPR